MCCAKPATGKTPLPASQTGSCGVSIHKGDDRGPQYWLRRPLPCVMCFFRARLRTQGGTGSESALELQARQAERKGK